MNDSDKLKIIKKVLGDSKVESIVSNFIKDGASDTYDFKKINNKELSVVKNGVDTYKIEQKGSKWTCSCPGFKYRGKCVHIQKFDEAMKDLLPKRYPRSEFDAFVPELENIFCSFDNHWAIVGSYRRKKSTFHDVDCLIACDVSTFHKLYDKVSSDPSYEETMHGDDIIRGKYHGYDLDFLRANENEWLS